MVFADLPQADSNVESSQIYKLALLRRSLNPLGLTKLRGRNIELHFLLALEAVVVSGACCEDAQARRKQDSFCISCHRY